MEDTYEQAHQLRALAMRVAALEDNVAFLERWCEEQQDSLDRAFGSVAYDYEIEQSELPPRAPLRVVDLRDVEDPDADDEDAPIVALVETEHDHVVRLIRAQLNRLRTRLAASLAPDAESPAERSGPPTPPPKTPKLSARSVRQDGVIGAPQ
jgi:hypothetical protein